MKQMDSQISRLFNFVHLKKPKKPLSIVLLSLLLENNMDGSVLHVCVA